MRLSPRAMAMSWVSERLQWLCLILLFSQAIFLSSATLLDEQRPILQPSLVEKVNSNPHSKWKADMNWRFANSTVEDFKRLLGAIMDDGQEKKHVRSHPRGLKLPLSFDSRDAWPQCTSLRTILDQGHCGSCWAFGAVESLSDRFCIHFNESVILSENDLLSCCGFECGMGCGGGMPLSAWWYLVRNGVVTTECLPYFDSKGCQHPGCEPLYPTPECVQQCTDNSDWNSAKYFAANAYKSMVMDRSVLSVRPPSVSIGSGSEHRLPGSICSFGLKAQHSSPLRFFQSLRQEDYRAVHRCKVSAEPQRKVKLEEFGLPDEFELPDFFEIDKDVAALELLFESEELLKTARHYEVMFLVHEDHVDQLQYVIQKVKDFIEDKKGKIHRINDWGMRKLAYKIKKSKMANYILMNIQLDARYTDEFKNLLDKDERIIRHLVMTMKRAETVDTIPPPEVSSISDEEYETDDEELEESYYEDDGDDVLQEAKDENLSRL